MEGGSFEKSAFKQEVIMGLSDLLNDRWGVMKLNDVLYNSGTGLE